MQVSEAVFWGTLGLVGVVVLVWIFSLIFKRPDLRLRDVGNGKLRVWSINDHETDFLFREIFEEGAYDDGPADTRPRKGDVVVDVGANIGMFSLWAAERVGSNGSVYAFEVIPRTYGALFRNAEMHSSKGALGSISVRNVGIGRRKEVVEFSVIPGITIWSTSYGKDFVSSRLEDLIEGVSRSVELDAKGKVGEVETWGTFWFRMFVGLIPSWLLRAILRTLLTALGGTPTVEMCNLEPLGVALQACGLPNGKDIGLLKIDVEGAEVDVLRGIDARTWGKIQRVAIEAEDKARSEECRDILEDHGFQVRVSDNPAVDAKRLEMHSELAMVYAWRQGPWGATTARERSRSRAKSRAKSAPKSAPRTSPAKSRAKTPTSRTKTPVRRRSTSKK